MSIVLVLITHAKGLTGFPPGLDHAVIRWLPNGHFGVEIFFAISGFLITFLLLKEKDRSGRVGIRDFYIRRAFRILPAYLLFLLALTAISIFGDPGLKAEHWIALATYTVNYVHIPTVAEHIWSLSVEEQFYLVWPCVVVWALARRRGPVALLLAASAPILVAPIANTLAYLKVGGPLFLGYSFLSQGQAISWGCLAAICCAYFGETVDRLLARYAVPICAAAIGLLLGEIFLSRLFLLGPLVIALGPAVRVSSVTALVLLSMKFSDRPGLRLLSWGPITYLGTLSYSIYLWQQVFMVDLRAMGLSTPQWLDAFPTWFIPVFATALLCHYLVERPFLRLGSQLMKARARSESVAPALAVNARESAGAGSERA